MDEIVRTFNKHRVRYLLIGAQAVRLHGMPRFSFDWDFYIPPKDADNIDTINKLLPDDLDLPLLALGPRGENFIQTYQTKYGLLQFHLAGPGFPKFEEAERRALVIKTESGVSVRCIGAEDLLRMKEASNRPQDHSDIIFLREKLNPEA